MHTVGYSNYSVNDRGDVSLLHARDTSLALISRAPLDKLEAYKRGVESLSPTAGFLDMTPLGRQGA